MTKKSSALKIADVPRSVLDYESIDQAFPEAIRANWRDNDMFIRLKIGSTWQVVGSDNFQSLIGSPPILVVFSEFAYANPVAWQKISPILMNNGGIAAFISTPCGRNHFHGLYEYAKSPEGREAGWFAELQTVEDSDAIVYACFASAQAQGKSFVWMGTTYEAIEQVDKDTRNNALANLWVFPTNGAHVSYHRGGAGRPIWCGWR